MNIKTIIHIIGIIIFFYSCTQKKSEESIEETKAEIQVSFTEAQLKTAGITYGSLESRSMNASVKVNGTLDVPPQNLVTISAFMGGFIRSTELLQGMKVKKGEVIAVIENPEFITLQREYLENKSNLEFIESDYKRQEEMIKQNVSSQKDFQKISSEYNSMLAAHGALKEKLRMIGVKPDALTTASIKSSVNILSPINGYVTAVNINIGKYVNPQDIICEIVDTDHLHVELVVFEKDITKVKVGQKVRFNIVNEDAKQRAAHVYLINHKISEDRTVRVHAHMDKEDPALIPNMYLQAYIDVQEKNVMALPDEAIVTSGNTNLIFIKGAYTNGVQQFEAVEVKKGLTENGYTEVVFPTLNMDVKNAAFVIKGAYDIVSKMNNIEEEE